LNNILSEDEVMERWHAAPWPVVFSSALDGLGVIETFNALLSQVYDSLNEEFRFQQHHGLSREDFVRQSTGQIAGDEAT
ncbi:MAG: GTPase, partial [Methylomonas sp.]